MGSIQSEGHSNISDMFTIRSTDELYNSAVIGNGEIMTMIGPTGYHNGFCLEDEDISEIMHFPATRRGLLDMLQVRITVFEDRVEIKAVFPIKPIDCQLLKSVQRP